MKWNFCFPDKPQEYNFYPFALCNDLFEEASSSLFHTHWYRGCLRCFIFVEQCCRYEFHHIHSPDRFTPLRLEWHCDIAVMFFPPSFFALLYWFQQEPTFETFIVASIRWTGNEDEMGFCIHKCSVMPIRGGVNRIQTNTTELCMQPAWWRRYFLNSLLSSNKWFVNITLNWVGTPFS